MALLRTHSSFWEGELTSFWSVSRVVIGGSQRGNICLSSLSNWSAWAIKEQFCQKVVWPHQTVVLSMGLVSYSHLVWSKAWVLFPEQPVEVKKVCVFLGNFPVSLCIRLCEDEATSALIVIQSIQFLAHCEVVLFVLARRRLFGTRTTKVCGPKVVLRQVYSDWHTTWMRGMDLWVCWGRFGEMTLSREHFIIVVVKILQVIFHQPAAIIDKQPSA